LTDRHQLRAARFGSSVQQGFASSGSLKRRRKSRSHAIKAKYPIGCCGPVGACAQKGSCRIQMRSAFQGPSMPALRLAIRPSAGQMLLPRTAALNVVPGNPQRRGRPTSGCSHESLPTTTVAISAAGVQSRSGRTRILAGCDTYAGLTQMVAATVCFDRQRRQHPQGHAAQQSRQGAAHQTAAMPPCRPHLRGAHRYRGDLRAFAARQLR